MELHSFQFNRLLALLAATFLTIQLSANNYPSVTPDNLQEVAHQIFEDHSPEISVSPADIAIFLQDIQTQFSELPEAPNVTVQNTEGGNFQVTFAEQTDYVGGWLHLQGGSSFQETFSGDNHSFNGLDNENVYLFAYAESIGGNQGRMTVLVLKMGCIIIDDEINYNGPCKKPNLLISGQNSVIVSLPSNHFGAYRIEVASANSGQSLLDTFYMGMSNPSAPASHMVAYLLDPAFFPHNLNNSYNTAHIYNTPQATLNFRFLPRWINGTARNAFQIEFVPNGEVDDVQINVVGCSQINLDLTERPNGNLTATGIYLVPNPATNTIALALDDTLLGASVSLYNALGQLVHNQRYNGPETLDIAHLPDGIYHVVAQSETDRQVAKLVKTSN